MLFYFFLNTISINARVAKLADLPTGRQAHYLEVVINYVLRLWITEYFAELSLCWFNR
jgi:hypothetical protein